MTKVFAAAQTKGGSTKTTTLLSLAVAFAQQGKKVFYLNYDPQAAMDLWIERRPDDLATIEYARRPVAEALNDIARIKADGFDAIFCDTAPRNSTGLLSLLGVADMVIVPTQPNDMDLDAVAETYDTIKTVPGVTDRLYSVIGRADTHHGLQQLNEDALEFLMTKYGMTPLGIMSNRIAFRKAFREGMGVTEFEPKGDAAEEVNMIVANIEKAINWRAAA